MPRELSAERSIRLLLCLSLLPLSLMIRSASGQFIDPNSALILNSLREISARHHLALQEQRIQTAKMVEQLRQFYDTYSLLRNDIEFTQNLYRDFKTIDNMDLTRSYSMSNFILNADRLDYWLPSTTGDLQRSSMDVESLINNSAELQRTYESFALSVTDGQAPEDAEQRRHNAIVGQQAFSQALFEYALKCQVLAKTYDSLAVELHNQVVNQDNNYKPAERTQLLLESVKLRDLSNSYYEKFLELSRKAHDTELEMYDEKLNFLRSRENWKTLKNQMNGISRVRYGFFDIGAAPFE